MISPSIRSLILGTIPLALTACMNAGPVDANPSTLGPVIGVDLGSSAGHMAAPSALASDVGPTGVGHERSPRVAGMQVAHEGHAHAQASGTVNSVDASSHKINISHGSIQALGWPPMTMDFPVAPSVDLKPIKPGSHVNFTLEKGSDGMPVIQSVSPAGAGG